MNDRLAECKKYKTFLLEVAYDGKLIGEGAKEGNNNNEANEAQQELPFSSVDELLDLFSKKEEENLFLIQILQRGEEGVPCVFACVCVCLRVCVCVCVYACMCVRVVCCVIV